MTAILAYENLLEHADSTVTATSEATGYDVENCFDWLTHDYWQATAAGTNYVTVDLGSAKAVDYWAVFAHDLADNSGGVRVQYSSDNFASDVNEYGGNLLTYSEQFDNAAWTKSSVTVTANATQAPDGTSTADLITPTGVTSSYVTGVSHSFETGKTYTKGVYAKAAGGNLLFIELIDFAASASVRFDLSSGAASVNSGSVDDYGIEAIGGGWYRCWATKQATTTISTTGGAYYVGAYGTGASGDSVYLWGAQLEEASSAGPYHPHPANGLIFYKGSEVSARYWRFRFADSTTASKIGVCALGKRLDLPVGMRVGFTAPHHGRRFDYLPQISESGRFIGRSLKRQGYETELSLQHVEAHWSRQYLQHFLSHADEKPFFFCWDDETYTWETAYCWLRDNPSISYSTPTRMDVRLPVGCLV